VIIAHDLEAEWVAPGELDPALVAEILKTYSGSLTVTLASSEMSRPAPNIAANQRRLL